VGTVDWPTVCTHLEQAVREVATICHAPCKLTFDLLTLKAVSESRVTLATSMPILVFLSLSVLDLGQMYVTDVRRRHTSDRQMSDAHHRLIPPTPGGGGQKTACLGLYFVNHSSYLRCYVVRRRGFASWESAQVLCRAVAPVGL